MDSLEILTDLVTFNCRYTLSFDGKNGGDFTSNGGISALTEI